MLPYRVTLIDLVELDMFDFGIILGMDWLYACYRSIDCTTQVVKFHFLNELILELKGGNSILRGKIISCLKYCNMIAKGCLYHVVRVKDIERETPSIELVPVVRDYQEVFTNDLPGVLPEWEIDFGIDL